MRSETTARAVILGRIRTALHDVLPIEQPEHVAVARDYRRSGTGTPEEVVERFCERVAEYKVTVQRFEEASLPQAIAAETPGAGRRASRHSGRRADILAAGGCRVVA